MKKVYFIIFLLVVSGCTNDSTELQSTKSELEEVKKQNVELNLQLKNQMKELESKQKEYELRNLLDIKAREIFRLMTENKEFELTTHLSKNLTSENKTVTYFVGDQKITVPFVIRGDTFRQRYYLLDKENTFITGYEVWHSDGTLSVILELKFVLLNNNWVLDGIQTDI